MVNRKKMSVVACSYVGDTRSAASPASPLELQSDLPNRSSFATPCIRTVDRSCGTILLRGLEAAGCSLNPFPTSCEVGALPCSSQNQGKTPKDGSATRSEMSRKRVAGNMAKRMFPDISLEISILILILLTYEIWF